jgi:surface protein
MEINFSNLDDIEIDKEGITKKKFNKCRIIVPSFSIFISIGIIILSFYYLIKKEKKEKKKEDEIIIKCIEGDDDLCSLCENDECVNCNYRYDLINGTCKPNFSFKVIYETTTYNETLELINTFYEYQVINMEIEGQIYDNDKMRSLNFKYTFENPDNHTIYYNFDVNNLYRIVTSLFPNGEKIIYIHFSNLFNTENITQMMGMFSDYKKLKYVDISNFDLKNMKKMEIIFSGCSSLTTVKLPNSQAPYLTSMSHMFSNCENLVSVDFSKGMNYSTNKLSQLEGMFSGCTSLKSVNFSYLKTSSIENTRSMFSNCTSLESLDLSKFETNNLVMDYMFSNCKSLKYLDISNFDIPLSYNNCMTNFPPKGRIKLNNNITKYFKKFIPKDWQYI